MRDHFQLLNQSINQSINKHSFNRTLAKHKPTVIVVPVHVQKYWFKMMLVTYET